MQRLDCGSLLRLWAATAAFLLGSGPRLAAASGAGGARPERAAAAAHDGAVDGNGQKALPPGHPPIGDNDQRRINDDEEASEDGSGDGDDERDAPSAVGGQLPPGHPPVDSQARPQGGPIGQGQDSVQVDGALPAGTVVVEIADGSDLPLPRVPVVLKLLVQTIARSDAQHEMTSPTDEQGAARFTQLPVGATASYRAQVTWPAGNKDAASYLSPPFQLDLTRGQKVRMHVYPATSDLSQSMVGMQGVVFVQLLDDVLQFHELFQIYNLGHTTWIPKDVIVDLPVGAKAFQSESGMDNVQFEEAGASVRLRGSVVPGQHEVEMQYQVPYDSSGVFETAVAMPPHVARMQVMVEGSKETRLSVQGFAPARVEKNRRGQRVLVAEREARPGERPVTRVEMRLENLPVASSAPRWAVAAAALALLVGVYFGSVDPGAEAGRGSARRGALGAEARRRIVAELAALEQAHARGAVGPKTYARARRELVDALARLLATAGEGSSA